MNKRKWLFVTAPFILFTIYTSVISSSFPAYPERMRWLVAIFFGLSFILLIAQKAVKDENYFVPTMLFVLLVNMAIIFAVDISQFQNLESMAQGLILLLERPQLILYFGLLLMALVPPILWQGSFTYYFSRLEYPEEDWQDPAFIKINRNISFFWVFVFLLCFLTQLVPLLVVQLFAPIIIVATLGAWGTKRMINIFINHLDAKAG